ncbi:MAG: DinB family protein, partial [Ginsengibacter sp.]
MENEEEYLRYPLGREEVSNFYDGIYGDALKHQLLNDIKMLPAMLEFATQNLNEDQLQTPYRPEGWTVHQLIHHIADSHINAYT